MNLEEIEENALNYLGQVTNPLVQISVLYDHVKSKSKEEIFSFQDFSDFIKQHEQIKFLDPLSMTDNQTMAASLEASGLTSAPCAMLATRAPSPQDLAASMVDQLKSMTEALTTALGEARAIGDSEKGHHIYNTLERIKALEEKLIAYTKPL